MRVGLTCPEGFLPVYSCATEDEALALVRATCRLGEDGHYYNDDLARAREIPVRSMADIDRQLASLDVFSDKLAAVHVRLRAARVRSPRKRASKRLQKA